MFLLVEGHLDIDVLSTGDVQGVALNQLLVLANRILQLGAPTAEDLLPEYTNLQELEVTPAPTTAKVTVAIDPDADAESALLGRGWLRTRRQSPM